MAQTTTDPIPPANPRRSMEESHFIMEGPKKALIFTVDTCEQCGKKVQGANAITAFHTRREFVAWGLVEVKMSDRLDEMGYCDALDGCACPDCFVNE